MHMKTCIYCKKTKEEKEFTLEHVISQFLGGAQAPDQLKTRDVCGTCNSNLGLFVDASFEKDFLVYSMLSQAAYSFFNPDRPTPLPLKCMGTSDLEPPEMTEDEICEYWIGPLGEQIYWIRPSDERMYWYSGGNPITTRKVSTRAYFLWSEYSQKNPMITWLSFGDAFKGRKVRKVSCTEVVGADPSEIGFSRADDLDLKRITYFNGLCSQGQTRQARVSMYLRHDVRFLAKLAIGIGHALFGETFDNSRHAGELHKALWYREGDPEPDIPGQSALRHGNEFLKSACGFNNAVTLAIIPSEKHLALNLNLSRNMNWNIALAELEDVRELMGEDLRHGICVILFKTLGKGVSISLPELIAHNQNLVTHQDLVEVEGLANNSVGYFENL
jgi:hypothetical protein